MALKKDYPVEYNTWRSMRQRCDNPNNKHYKNYGARGIKVCDEWANDFFLFLEDMGERPEGDYSIERVKNGEGYNKENCKWATRYEQNRNHRRNHLLTHEGVTKHLTDWASAIGITQQALQGRLKNMPLARALTMEANPDRKRYIEANGKRLTIDGWARELGLDQTTIWRRLKNLTPEEALKTRSKKDADNGIAKKAVRQLTKEGVFIAEFFSISEAGRQTGVDFRLISAVLNGKQNTTGGFRWEFK